VTGWETSEELEVQLLRAKVVCQVIAGVTIIAELIYIGDAVSHGALLYKARWHVTRLKAEHQRRAVEARQLRRDIGLMLFTAQRVLEEEHV
jgi:hypothetical protein